jgi:hypothetical protein
MRAYPHENSDFIFYIKDGPNIARDIYASASSILALQFVVIEEWVELIDYEKIFPLYESIAHLSWQLLKIFFKCLV